MGQSLNLVTSKLFQGLCITALNLPPSSLSRCQITRGFEGWGRAGCQSWTCDGQLPLIRQILKTKWRVGMDSVSLDSFANCAVANDWMDSSKGRARRWKMATVMEGQLWHLTREKDIHSAPDTFTASPIPIHFHPIFLHFYWFENRYPLLQRRLCEIVAQKPLFLLVGGRKFKPQLGQNRHEHDRIMRSDGPRHLQQPRNELEDPRTTTDCQKPAPSVRLVPVMKLSVSAGLLWKLIQVCKGSH